MQRQQTQTILMKTFRKSRTSLVKTPTMLPTRPSVDSNNMFGGQWTLMMTPKFVPKYMSSKPNNNDDLRSVRLSLTLTEDDISCGGPASLGLAVDIGILGQQHFTDVSIARLSCQVQG